MRITEKYLLYWSLLLLISACSKEEPATPTLSAIAITINGQLLTDGVANIPTTSNLELTFSAALEPRSFEAAFALTQGAAKVPVRFSYTNAGTKAVVTLENLQFNTRYQLQVPAVVIGLRGEQLNQAISLSFTTREQGLIMEMAPCISATGDCLQSFSVAGTSGASGTFTFYGSYPIFLQEARWKNLKHAVIVLHGQNRDADAYFTFLTTTLRQENLQNEVILLAPYFKSNTEAKTGELFWSANGWREGQPAGLANVPASPFEMLDRLVERLSSKAHFPVLENILITGHSSGALLTQLYAALNQMEKKYPDLNFSYAVANTQYFYYPDDVRYDEAKAQFFTPVNCPAYRQWPLGFTGVPAYAANVTKPVMDQQLTSRDITYVLGNGNSPDPTLNTSDCDATLLGSSRFKRGENFFTLLETRYAGTHKSRKLIVQGIGHDGQGIYQSGEFKAWLRALWK